MSLALFVAGGTGGHLYPGIAAARALKSPWEKAFVVRKGDKGKEILEREGFRVMEISGQGWPRRFSWKMLSFPFVLAAGFFQAWSILGQMKPTVIVGMGGYLSFPFILLGRVRGIKTLIHEQNVYPGISNRLLSRWVQSVAVSFEESRTAFPSRKVWVSGLPVRPEIGTVSAAEGRRHFKLANDKLTFLIFGGSQGAHRINDAVVETWSYLSDRSGEFQVLHVTGERDFVEIKKRYNGLPVKAEVIAYCHDMPAAYGAADFVICRAGASTIAELLLAQKPSLLVPFPFASENHQFYNAEVMVKSSVAELIPDADFSPVKLAERLRLFLNNPDRILHMQQRLASLANKQPHTAAAQRLADYIAAVA